VILAYHAIFTTYGTWLPNDPRGSYSQAVYQDELRALGPIRYGRQDPQPGRSELRRFWTAAAPRLGRSPYFIDDATRAVVASGFEAVVERLGLTIHACAIMNDHVHVLVRRSGYRIEYLVNQLKGAATRALDLAKTPWARKGWKVYLDARPAVVAAAKYIEANPIAAGLKPQTWAFVTGLDGAAYRQRRACRPPPNGAREERRAGRRDDGEDGTV